MKECVIFCAAGFDGLAIPLTEEDYLIAADGGLKHMASLGVTPNAIIVDFYSLNYIFSFQNNYNILFFQIQ